MKKLMLMTTCALMAAGLFAGPRSLVATAEVAPFTELTPMATAIGKLVNNPVMPAIMLGGVQHELAKNYGALRNEAPLRWQIYLEDDKFDLANLEKMQGAGEVVMVYPLAETEESFLKKHADATKAADGTIRLPAGAGRAEEMFAKFTADGKFCVFAQTATSAKQAAADADRQAVQARRPNHKSSLVRVVLTEKGIGLLVAACEQENARQRKVLQQQDGGDLMQKFLAFQNASQQQNFEQLKSFASVSLAFDIDDHGFVLSGEGRRKPGAVPLAPGKPLPVGAFDILPAGANLMLAFNCQAVGQFGTAEDFAQQKALTSDLLKSLNAALAAEAAKDASLKKYERVLKDLIDAFDETVQAAIYPAATDWSSLALGFDAQQHPVLVGVGADANGTKNTQIFNRFMGRLVAAFARQWPNRSFLTKTSNGAYLFDWGTLIDLVAAETGTTQDVKTMKECAEAKETVAKILGGCKTELAVASAPSPVCRLASPGVNLAPRPAGAGEARFLAAVPEAANKRPFGAFYCTPYACMRDVILPIVAKVGDPDEARRTKAQIAKLPPASPKGALAGAAWTDRDGSTRFVLRLTADEVKSWAAMSAAANGDSDEDDADDDEK